MVEIQSLSQNTLPQGHPAIKLNLRNPLTRISPPEQ